MFAQQGRWALEFPVGAGSFTGWFTMGTSPSPGWLTVVVIPRWAM